MSLSTTTRAALPQEWLPIPKGIFNDADSFAGDLIRQFDKKRSRLQKEFMGGEASDSDSSSSPSSIHPPSGSRSILPERHVLNQGPSESSDYEQYSPHSAVQERTEPEQEETEQQQDQQQQASSVQDRRRRSAGELLRRSSAYLRAKFEAFKHETMPEPDPRILFRKSHPAATTATTSNGNNNKSSSRGIMENSSMQESNLSSSFFPLPSKIAINTTISIPQISTATSMHYASVQPPVITQYPPKPLKYSPVEPPSASTAYSSSSSPFRSSPLSAIASPAFDTQQKKPKHRISLPLLNRPNAASPSSSSHQEDRRRSDSDAIHGRFGSIGKKAKRWSRLLCKPAKKSKGKERAI
ncbi:hypothetical protein EC973_008409 [Apophysomyces ossiformis]|uniref:Uncharacterized protein n=1 Tax=Apophysomyces ossiformis TaxID=679940 RepID=A0A8H7BN13_9FUNG|nr:hypothetical protein EC973_008409 [Apophysomyces ossiformis]